MPFAAEFDDVYETIRRAVEASVPGKKLRCYRLDEVKYAGRITDDLLRELQESVVCVADLSGSKPNVMWEVGYAMALRKPVLFVTQNIDDMPFDIKDLRAIPYTRQSLEKGAAAERARRSEWARSYLFGQGRSPCRFMEWIEPGDPRPDQLVPSPAEGHSNRFHLTRQIRGLVRFKGWGSRVYRVILDFLEPI